MFPPQVDAEQRVQAGFGAAGVRVAAGHDSMPLQYSTKLCALTIQWQGVTVQPYIPHTACTVKKTGCNFVSVTYFNKATFLFLLLFILSIYI